MGDDKREIGMSKKQFYENEIRQRLDLDSKYREFLFPRDYIVSNVQLNNQVMSRFPFYEKWKQYDIGDYHIYVQQKAHCYTVSHNGKYAALIGHAFDPFTSMLNETDILTECLISYEEGYSSFFEVINRITGVFVVLVSEGAKLLAVQDCTGMQMLYYGEIEGSLWLSSAPQLLGDICHLDRSPQVLQMLNGHSYYLGSRYLPGDLSPYSELRRLGANLFLEYNNSFTLKRFFPVTPRPIYSNKEQKETAIEEIYTVFRRNIEMILEKWKHPALSLSGGVDSKTTLACANGLYDKIMCYSFASKPSEKLDADAAAQICKNLGIPHRYYTIPEDPSEIRDYDFLSKLIDHNTSYLMKLNKNELRKYIYFSQIHDFDVEIKSDTSEIGRAIMQKKYNVRLPDILAPRHLSIFQARYVCEPRLLRMADCENGDFMERSSMRKPILGYEHINLFFWEIRLASWYATAFHSHQFFNEVVIPYNNRKMMDMFYGFTYQERMEDKPHMMLMERGNPKVSAMDISVKDTYFGKKRVMLETLYYLYATRLNTMGEFTPRT